jgi:hypothetical protein
MDLDFNLKILSFRRKIFVSKEWVRFGIVTLAVLMSMVLTYWGSSQEQVLLLALFGGLVGFVTLIRNLNLGFLMILIGGMFVPYSGPAGANAAVIMVAIMIGLWFMDMIVVRRDVRWTNSRALLPIAVMIVLSTISFGMGWIPWFVFAGQAPLDAQLGGFAVFILSLGCTLAAANLIRDISWIKYIVWTFIGLSTFYVIGRLIGFSVGRLYQFGFIVNSMFWTWLVSLALAQFFFNTKLKMFARVLILGVVLITMYIAIFQANDWKSGWLPPFVAILVLIGLKYKRLTIIVVPIALIVAVYLAGSLISSDEYSWGTRIDAWQIVIEISRVSPLFGLGFSNYYWYTPLFPIRGWSVNFNSHSQFIDLIAQVGVLGLICFLWIFFEMLRLSWRLLQNKLLTGFTKAYVYSVFAGIIATLVAAFLGDWVLPFIYNVGLTGFRASILPWIFMGGLVAIEKLSTENKQLS